MPKVSLPTRRLCIGSQVIKLNVCTRAFLLRHLTVAPVAVQQIYRKASTVWLCYLQYLVSIELDCYSWHLLAFMAHNFYLSATDWGVGGGMLVDLTLNNQSWIYRYWLILLLLLVYVAHNLYFCVIDLPLDDQSWLYRSEGLISVLPPVMPRLKWTADVWLSVILYFAEFTAYHNLFASTCCKQQHMARIWNLEWGWTRAWLRSLKIMDTVIHGSREPCGWNSQVIAGQIWGMDCNIKN